MRPPNLVVRMQFGSHLYGTATPTSDTDYKGVYLPSRREVLLGRIPKTWRCNTKAGSDQKNAATDTDEEIYSLHYFIELACQGQTAAIDMLHAPADMLTDASETWADLQGQRERFYTKNLNAFIGYARRQAAKYGIKGSRLASARMVLDYLAGLHPETRLADVWDALPAGEHIHKLPGEKCRLYQVCGKLLQDTTRAKHYTPMLRQYVQEYGERARLAELNQGVDWKAVSHAFRAGFQIKAVLTLGGFSYPLPEAAFLVRVKTGQVPYPEAGPALEDLIDECEALSAASSLPANVDRAYWDDWLCEVMERAR